MTPAFENITELTPASGLMGSCRAAYADTPVKPLNQDRVRDIATQALEDAFRSEMDRLMYVAIAGSPADHLEAIIKANSSVEQLVDTKKWIGLIAVPDAAHLEAAVPPAPAEAPSSPVQASAREAVETAFYQQMGSLMDQALMDSTPEAHNQWREAARHLLDQRHAALLWQHAAFSGDEAQVQGLPSLQVFCRADSKQVDA